jgi:predicted Zn-dependent protease
MAESDVVISGSSPLANLLGASISAPSLHISDDPTRFDLAGAFDHDDEGEPATSIPLVRAGRFESFLCDTAGATELHARAGRARRSGWAHQPVARLSNLVVTAGDTDPDQLEKELDHGLVVTQVGGATVDPLASRLVLRVERGWEVRHGRRRRPLAPCELTGQVMDVLARIDSRIGDDPTPDWRLGWCVKDGLPLPTGSEAPSLLVGGLEVL